MTTLEPGDLLTAIRLPATWAGARFYFEKIRDREVWDFPLVNVASALKPVPAGDRIDQIRMVVGAVVARPYRLWAVEAAVTGQPITEATAELAGGLAVDGAVPLQHMGIRWTGRVGYFGFIPRKTQVDARHQDGSLCKSKCSRRVIKRRSGHHGTHYLHV